MIIKDQTRNIFQTLEVPLFEIMNHPDILALNTDLTQPEIKTIVDGMDCSDYSEKFPMYPRFLDLHSIIDVINKVKMQKGADYKVTGLVIVSVLERYPPINKYAYTFSNGVDSYNE